MWLLRWIACAGTTTPVPPLVTEATGPPLPPQKVVFVGVDGATWKVMGPLVAAGEMPNFARLQREGASLTAFDTLHDTNSPIIWTTIATGRPPEVHGVRDYTETLPDGSKVPITSRARRVNALWNAASDNNVDVAVFNWWASWPAEEVRGLVVSDHANPAASKWMADRYWTADAAALQGMHVDTWPRDLDLQRYWLDPNAFPLDDLAARAGLTEAQKAAAAEAPFNKRTTWSWFKTFYAVDRPHLSMALDRITAGDTDLVMVYLRGPDPVQHYAWDTVEPEAYARPAEHLERDVGVVQGVYRYVDGFLGEVLAALGPDTTLIVASDHGAEPCESAGNPARRDRPGCHTFAAKGVLFLYGPAIRPGLTLAPAGPLDLAPTVAWALDVPLAEDQEGRVLTEAFTDEFRTRRPARRVPTWGARAEQPPLPSAADPVLLEQLKGLGYISD